MRISFSEDANLCRSRQIFVSLGLSPRDQRTLTNMLHNRHPLPEAFSMLLNDCSLILTWVIFTGTIWSGNPEPQIPGEIERQTPHKSEAILCDLQKNMRRRSEEVVLQSKIISAHSIYAIAAPDWPRITSSEEALIGKRRAHGATIYTCQSVGVGIDPNSRWTLALPSRLKDCAAIMRACCKYVFALYRRLLNWLKDLLSIFRLSVIQEMTVEEMLFSPCRVRYITNSRYNSPDSFY